MSLERLQAALADRYRFERQLGQGGMATVYLAHDIRHNRPVAIKVLKPELAAVLGGERFVQEIRTTASLQHPHILPLFDSGTADSFLFYVMPYVEGETLRDKLNRETQLGLDEAIRIATEVADALDYAHRHGVIHRDIKPENILLHDGRPVVADFGIALAVSAAAGGRMTETGLSLGTPHYMSPEQATADREITARSDIYSLASVLYEMLAGQPPHIGTSAQHIIMQIVTGEPRPVTEFRKSVPPTVAAAVMQALEKLPADRFTSAAEFAAALRGQVAVRRTGTGLTATPSNRRWRQIALVAGLLAVGFAAVAGWALLRHSDGPRERVEFAYQANTSLNDRLVIRVSSDGRKVIQSVHDSNGVSHIVIRDLASTALTIVPGTENAGTPVLSPDGKTLAYVADMKLRTVPIAGGPSTILADSVMESSPSWSEDGRSLFFVHNMGALRRIPLSGGAPEVVTAIDTARREFAHWSPQILPGGKAVVFNSFSAPFARSRIEAVDLATGRRTVLIEGAMSPRYVREGYLLFAREEGIFAVRFDPGALRVTGTPVPVLDDVAMSITDGEAAFDVSPGGTLAYIRASEWKRPMRVVWVDRTGAERPLLPESGPWAEPRLSPDGRWLALTRTEPRWQVWLYDLARGVLTHLSRTEGVSFNAVWTPDSRSLIHSVETPVYDLRFLPIDGTPARSLVSTLSDKKAGSVSPDGRTLVYLETESTSHLKVVPLAGGASSRVDPADVTQRNAVFSPDGRWLAYEEIGSNQAIQVWVRALREGGGRRQVSADGGSQPRWSRGGREIVYRKGGLMVAAGFDPATGEVGAPAPLFRKPEAGGLGASAPTVGYDVTADGSRFVLIIPEELAGAQPTVVVLNWMEELRRTVLNAR